MQFCTTCGRYLSEYDDICPECGTVIHPERLIEYSYPYPYRVPVFIISLVAFAVGAFALTYLMNAYLFLIFVPFIFFGWDRTRPLTYILMGMTFGVGLGLIAAWVYRFSGLF